MKKLSLKNAKTLSRNEMKAISGGYAFGRHCTNDGYTQKDYCCNYTFGISHNCSWV